MKRRLLRIALLFAAVLLLVTGMFYRTAQSARSADAAAEQIIALNEIKQLTAAGQTQKAVEKCEALEDTLRGTQTATADGRFFVLCGICIMCIAVNLGYIYISILRPFEKLKTFAAKLSEGDFSLPLQYERSNYFGAFTWSFDQMRREITKARASEREAIENNKTVIATLSHDIKTPIASIRAYAEGLEAGLDATPEKRAKYLRVLMRKCDEVAHLTDDLFLHSISDLEKLKMEAEPTELCAFLTQTVAELGAQQGDLRFSCPSHTITAAVDRSRLVQLTENLVNNARKYAKTEIDITLTAADGFAVLTFRDHGSGIADADAPFLFDKFYRGQNCGNEQGSGLGLYIVRYIARQLRGDVLLCNHTDGLEVIVRLPLLS